MAMPLLQGATPPRLHARSTIHCFGVAPRETDYLQGQTGFGRNYKGSALSVFGLFSVCIGPLFGFVFADLGRFIRPPC